MCFCHAHSIHYVLALCNKILYHLPKSLIYTSFLGMSLFGDQIILVNKPLTWTSFDVVKKVKGMFKIKKIGHAGTLDPLAEGLLVLAMGKKTKELEAITKLEKEYVGTFVLGATTPTLDREMVPTSAEDTSQVTLEQL